MPSLQNFAWSLSRNHARAEDLVQDTVLRAWRARHTYQSGTNLEGWLFVIMRNTFYSQARKRQREVEDADGANAARLSLPPAQADWLDLQDVQLALEKLPDDQRQALVLITLNGMSYEEAAAVMQCKLGTVKSRINRARDRLTQLLGYTGLDLGSDDLTRAVTNRTSMAWPID